MSYKITEINEIDVIGSGWYNQRMCYPYKYLEKGVLVTFHFKPCLK